MKRARRKNREQIRCHVRWLIRRDMPEVCEIEDLSFEYAWDEKDFLKCLRERNCIGMVAEYYSRSGEEDPPVVGFMIYEMLQGQLHVINLAVHPGYRRQGVASQMMGKLRDKLSSHRRKLLTADPCETNLPAQLFFKAQRFKATEVLHKFYTHDEVVRDAYHMEYRLQ